MKLVFPPLLFLFALAATQAAPEVEREPFGALPDGREVTLFTLRNAGGMVARLTDFGATLVELHVPGRDGALADVALGFDDLESYLKRSPKFGATVGRYANRIAGASFELDGDRYELAANLAPHSLHGGVESFDRFLWEAEPVSKKGATGIAFRRVSPDGEEGFPGALSAKVSYFLSEENVLEIEYEATTDAPTLCSLTHHTYFNLAGHGSGSVLDQILQIEGDFFLAIDDDRIPTGEIRSVEDTVFDFRQARPIGSRMDLEHPALSRSRGYDHCFVLRNNVGEFVLAARASDPASGRAMEVWTDKPGLQLYTANFLGDGMLGKDGARYGPWGAFCLEPQLFPDTPHQQHFPSATLRPGEVYRSRTEFRFSVEP